MSEPSLNTVAGQIGHQWMEVGYLLGFTKAELENIEHDYTRLIDINTNMLIQWKQRQEGDLSEDQMLNTLNSTFQECKLENKAYWTIEVNTDIISCYTLVPLINMINSYQYQTNNLAPLCNKQLI